ncbi:tetratricopeptide repeat protein [candidate division CSSED10-310 bacterium]|uniref:Tetratricopeptide repeat protein n=1 Tax=candidate division CSSED10-310 bacterium TaxID=2855610 RepID=A0ABV6YTK1_UNCC1
MKNIIPQFIQEHYNANNQGGVFQACTMFVDISGFTQTTEALIRSGQEEGAEILSEIMRFYFTPAVNSVYGHRGFITGFAGDSFTAVFIFGEADQVALRNSRRYRLSCAKHVLKTAHEINLFFADHPLYYSKYGDFEFGVKIGMAIGEVQWGIVGSDEFKTYYFKGKAIDECAFAEHQAEKGEIWAARRMIDLIKNHVHFMESGAKTYTQISTIFAADLPKSRRFKHWQIDPDIVAVFISADLLSYHQAEFRRIVSVCIAFENVSNMNTFISLVLEQARTLGGTISHLDFGDKGGNLLFFFGAPLLFENTPSRALHFILGLQECVDQAINLRAGITTGVSYCGFNFSDVRSEFTCLGNAVNQSARFMMKAEWNQIFIDESMSRTKGFDFIYKGNLEYKGRKDLIPTYVLTGQIISPEDTFFTGKTIGREAELDKLTTFCLSLLNNLSSPQRTEQNKEIMSSSQAGDNVRTNRFGGIIYVYGEAGIGKSRLCFDLTKKLKPLVTTFLLQTDSILKKSFNPFIFFLRHYFNQDTVDTVERKKELFENIYHKFIEKVEDCQTSENLQAQKESTIKELIRIKSILGALMDLHWPNSLYESLDPRGRFENTLFAFKEFFKALSMLQPTILLLEDLHWLDSDSHKLFKIITRKIEDYPLMILITSRLNDDGSKPVLQLDENVIQQETVIGDLIVEGIEEFVEQQLEHQAGLELVSLIKKKTHGNPFYIEQFCVYLQENDLLELRENRLVLKDTDLKIPVTISAVIIARIDRLTVEVKDAVQIASVLGRQFERRVLKALFDKYRTFCEHLSFGGGTDSLLIEVENEHIWVRRNELENIFQHALLQEVAYDMQLRQRLRELHTLAAQSLEKLYPDHKGHYADLAYHYRKAEIGPKTIEYSEKAADFAKEKYENEHALTLYQQLLDILEHPFSSGDLEEDTRGLRIKILIQKGDILELIGLWDQALTVFRQALNLACETEDQGRVALSKAKIGNTLLQRGNVDDSLSLFKQALEIYTERRDTVGIGKIMLSLGTLYSRQGDMTEAIAWMKKILKISENMEDEELRGQALGNLGLISWVQGQYDDAMTYLEQTRTIYERLSNKRFLGIVAGNMGLVYKDQGNLDEALACYEQHLAIASEVGNKQGISIAVGNVGTIYEEQGQFDEAITCYEQQLTMVEELGYAHGRSLALGNLGCVFRDLGEYELALQYLDQSIINSQETGQKDFLSGLLYTKAEVLFELQQYAEITPNIEEALTFAKTIGDSMHIFKSNVLKHKLQALSDPQGAIQSLLGMLTVAKDSAGSSGRQADIAMLHYEIGKIMRHDECSSFYGGKSESLLEAKEHRMAALELYQELYKQNPRFVYLKKIDELQSDW